MIKFYIFGRLKCQIINNDMRLLNGIIYGPKVLFTLCNSVSLLLYLKDFIQVANEDLHLGNLGIK